MMTLRASNSAEGIRLFQVKQDRLNVTLPANILKKKNTEEQNQGSIKGKGKGKVHPCTGTGALYRPYGP